MAKIVALRGVGDDAAPIATRPALTLNQVLLWTASLGTVGYIFWEIAHKPRRSRKKRRA